MPPPLSCKGNNILDESTSSGDDESSSESEIEERLFALFPEDEWVYSMLSYFDESTSQAEVTPASAISAVTATGLQWKNFSRAWLKVLEDPGYDVRDKKGRRVFHTAEFESPEGRKGTVYEKWSDKKLMDFNRALCDVIAQSGVQISAASVLVNDYAEVSAVSETIILPSNGQEVVASRKQLFGDKYVFCAFWAMVFASEEARDYHPKSTQIIYNFESGGGYQSKVEAVYSVAMKLEENYFRFFDQPNFVDKGFAVPLQAADKIAYEAAKHVSHANDPNPPERHSILREDGQRTWKTRFTLQHLVLNGLDMNIRSWRKDDIEAFFRKNRGQARGKTE